MLKTRIKLERKKEWSFIHTQFDFIHILLGIQQNASVSSVKGKPSPKATEILFKQQEISSVLSEKSIFPLNMAQGAQLYSSSQTVVQVSLLVFK